MWLIARTKPNQEKKAELNLINQGFRAYLPRLKRKKLRNNVWVDVKELLFSGYIFIEISEFDIKITKINSTYGVSRLLIDSSSLKPHIISDDVINYIKSRIIGGLSDLDQLTKYDKVEVTSGNTNQLSGVFLEKCSNKRSKVLINILKKDRIVFVETSKLQPVL